MNVFVQSDQPLDKLQVIHRYRPHSSNIPPIVENGRVQNYTHHVGSALHAKNYVDYYMKEGIMLFSSCWVGLSFGVLMWLLGV